MARKLENIIGQCYDDLTVISIYRKNNKTYCICKCICGTNDFHVRKDVLKSRQHAHCGCLSKRNMYNEHINKVYGRLIVTDVVYINNIAHCICNCECGAKNLIINTSSLKRKLSQSCGCLHIEKIKQSNTKGLLGRRFGRLTVIEDSGERWNSKIVYSCNCDCGISGFKTVSYSLSSGITRSCGCLSKEISRINFIKFMNNVNNIQIHTNPDNPQQMYTDYEIIIAKKICKEYSACFICENSDNLHAHHLFSQNYKPELAIDQNNLIYLCMNCHANFHTEYGFGMNTFNQFFEFTMNNLQ